MPVKNRHFSFVATVSTDSPDLIRSVLETLIGNTQFKEVGGSEFRIETEKEGPSARELNRELLSTLRKVERKTRLRAEWTSGGTIERYFDYVLKKRAKSIP